LQAEFSGVEIKVNEKAPRKKSLEVSIVLKNQEPKLLWSGLERGPPRDLKFPSDPAELISLAIKEIKQHEGKN